MDDTELLRKAVSELRRGVIVLAVLSQLSEAQYGYQLMKELSEKGLDVEQGTLYPLLRRLESQGLLDSDWRVEADRPRRYYVLSAQGAQIFPQLEQEWADLVATLGKVLAS